MAKKPTDGASAEGRVLPPPHARFTKGKSGNPRGRPKGPSITGLTRKFALKRQVVTMDGEPQKLSRLEVAILKMQALAAMGKPAAAQLINNLRGLTRPEGPEQDCGFLVVPEQLTMEEFLAEEEARNATRVEPGTAINVEAEEFLKAVRGEPTVYGEALLAFHRKYRG
jgi:hypothetical protein